MLRFVLLTGLLMGVPVAARAGCVMDAPTLLWSYPAEGDQDVPTNATFWVLSTATSMVRPGAWLNDVPVPTPSERNRETAGLELDHLRVQPGELRPNTAYTLRVRYPWPDEAQGHGFAIHFRTGSARARPGAKSRVVGRAQLSPAKAHVLPCQELFNTQGCFDTLRERPPQIQTFELAGGAPLAWFVETGEAEGALLWPAHCGDPAIFVPESRGNECFTLRAIGNGGLMSRPIRHCIGASDVPTRASKRGFQNVGRGLSKRGPIYEPRPTAASDETNDDDLLDPAATTTAGSAETSEDGLLAPAPGDVRPPAPPPKLAPKAAPEGAPVARRGCALGASDSAPWWVLLGLLLWRRRAARITGS